MLETTWDSCITYSVRLSCLSMLYISHVCLHVCLLMLYVLYVCICPPFLKWAAQGCKKELQPKLTNKVVKYRIVKAALGLAIELLQERENSNILKLTTTEETSPPSLLPSLPTFLPPAPRSVASRIMWLMDPWTNYERDGMIGQEFAWTV